MDTETRYAYCSACDQNVPVALKEGGSPDDPSDLICLAYGETCTGRLCPLFGTPPEGAGGELGEPGLDSGRADGPPPG